MPQLRSSLKGVDVLVSLGALVVAVAAVVVGSMIGGKAYVLVSFIVVICALIPFFVHFEHGKPQAREIALVAVMCALAVASRVAFVWIPFFKPFAAIVMIGGMAFGRRTGFLIGALAMLASNFIFGQGPWTPWQMLSFGLCGYAFGALANIPFIRNAGSSWWLWVVVGALGAAFVICIAGPVLDTSSLFYMFSNITLESAIAVYAAGFIPNCIQGAATFATLLLVARPILRMIERISLKYGMFDDDRRDA